MDDGVEVMKTATREINRELVNRHEQYLLEYMLGAGSHTPKKDWGLRNRFLTASNHADTKVLLEMEARGLVRHYRLVHPLRPEALAFSATELGCKAIGLHDEAIKRAME